MDKRNICIVSTEYAFEYPRPGEYLFPFKVLALALTERGCNVTIVCLGPNLDVSYKGIRIKAVEFSAGQSKMRRFGAALQIWEYYSAVRACLNKAIIELAREMHFDVIECCGITAGDAVFESHAARVLRLSEARMPSMAPDDHADLNIALLRIRQDQTCKFGHAYLNESSDSFDDRPGCFRSEDCLEGLTFTLSSTLPDPVVPKNDSKSVFVGYWFLDSASCRQFVVEIAAKLQERGVKARFLFPCDCTPITVTSEPHCETVQRTREMAKSRMGSSECLWIIHNMKSPDILNCLSISEAVLMPSGKDDRFERLDSVSFASPYYGKPLVKPDISLDSSESDRETAAAVLAEQLDRILVANSTGVDLRLSETTKQKLQELVDQRIAAYTYAVESRGRTTPARTSDELSLVLDQLDRIAVTQPSAPSIASKIRRRLEHLRRKPNEVRS